MHICTPEPFCCLQVNFLDLSLRVYLSAEAHGGDHAGAGYLNESLARMENDQVGDFPTWLFNHILISLYRSLYCYRSLYISVSTT